MFKLFNTWIVLRLFFRTRILLIINIYYNKRDLGVNTNAIARAKNERITDDADLPILFQVSWIGRK